MEISAEKSKYFLYLTEKESSLSSIPKKPQPTGISATDKVSLVRNKQEYVVDVSLSDEIKPGTIGASQELISEYPIMEWDNVLVSFVRNNPLSLQAIRKKLLWGKLSREEINAIIEDMQNNKLSDLLLAYYTATSFFLQFWPPKKLRPTLPRQLAYTWDYVPASLAL